jgi:hypothetical protein
MAKRKIIVILLTIIPLLILNGFMGASAKPAITGIYSDMCYNTESGDVVGMEIYLVYSKAGYYVIYQASEGEPSVPVIVKATIGDSTIEFQIPEGVPFSGDFQGRITSYGIEGRIAGYSGYASKLRLKRQLSYWQRSPDKNVCRNKK